MVFSFLFEALYSIHSLKELAYSIERCKNVRGKHLKIYKAFSPHKTLFCVRLSEKDGSIL